MDLRPGDRVSATAFVGGFAEQILVDARGLTPIPDGVDYADAAAFGVTNRTAYYTLRTVAPVKPGDWVVVLGAAGGGPGRGRHRGSDGRQGDCGRVGRRQAGGVPAAGCRGCIDYDREDLKARLKEITGEAGAQVVLDPVGGRYAEPALRGLGRGAVSSRWATRPADPEDPAEPGDAQGNHVGRHGDPDLRHRLPGRVGRDDAELRQLFAEGKLRPYIGARFPLEQAPAALRYVADRKAVGKVVIDVA